MSLLFDHPAIYLVTSGEAMPRNYESAKGDILRLVGAAVDAGVSLIQLREKQLTARELYLLAVEAVHITRASSTRLLINDRADIAIAAGADGVHLTSKSLSAKTVRTCFASSLIIGVSTHSLSEVKTAAEQGADFAVFGPVFESPGKGDAQGLDKLADVCAAVGPFPILGLGGIDESNYRLVLDAGAAGFAAIRALNTTGNVQRIMEQVRK